MTKQGQSNTFGGLGETKKNSLATEKGCFRQTRKRDKKGLNCQNRGESSIGKGTFGGLGKAHNISLATEKGCLQQIKKECNIYTDHQKNIFDSSSKV